MNKQTAWFIATHIGAVIVAIAAAVMAAGPDKIADLYSHDPVKVTVAAASLILATASAIAAGTSGALFKPVDKK